MLFKHQLPRPLPCTAVVAASSTAGPPTSAFLAAKSGPRRLHVFKWDRFLGVVEAPAEVTCCMLLPSLVVDLPHMSLVVGCRPGTVYRVEDVEARLAGGASGGGRSSSAVTLRLGPDELCLTLPGDVQKLAQLIGVGVKGEGTPRQGIVAVVERETGTAVYHIPPPASNGASAAASPSMVALEPPGRLLACLSSSTGNDPILLHVCHDRSKDPTTAARGSRLYSTPLIHTEPPAKKTNKSNKKAELLHSFDKQVVAVLSVRTKEGEKDTTLAAVERDGQISLIPSPMNLKASHSTSAENVRRARLEISPVEGGIQAAVLVGSGDLLACLSSCGSVWLTRLSLLFALHSSSSSSSYSSSSSANCVRLGCAPDAVAFAAPSSSSPHQSPFLCVLTRRGLLLCFNQFPSMPPSPPLDITTMRLPSTTTVAAMGALASTIAATAADETETLLQQIEQACKRTHASHQQVAQTEEALETLRTAWTVLAGKGLLDTSLDVTHPSSSTAARSPLLKVRLCNPTENETLPLQGWSLMVRIEAAAASVAQGPVASLLPALSPPGAAVLAGASWGLDDLGPGEDFEAHMALPVTGSLLPQTVRVSLCCPFAGAVTGEAGAAFLAGQQEQQQQQQAGVCLELGSRPIDMLDLARAPRNVPVTPAEMRAMEAAAAKQGRNQSWEGCLARLLFERVAGCDNGGQDGGAEVGERLNGGADLNKGAVADALPSGGGGGGGGGGRTATPMPLPKPLLSSTLRILWPALPTPTEQQHEAMDVDAGPLPLSLPALVDLLGPCDGVKIPEEGGGRALALQAPGGRLLLARLLAGHARIQMDENESSEATGLQLSLTGTDQGLVSLLRAACFQRLGMGGSVRTRRLPLTDTRMKTLETAHHQATALAAELQEVIARDREQGEGTVLVQAQRQRLQECVGLARRVVTLAVALGKEVDEAFLLDLRSEVGEELRMKEFSQQEDKAGEEAREYEEEGSVY